MSLLRRWSELVVALVLTASAPAAAQPEAPSDAQKNAAQSLFDEARRLTEEGQVAEACAKLGESLRLYAASGTLLNLALCHERAGRTGSAYTEFNESLARAQRDRRPDREQTARSHLAALSPRLSRLTVTVAPVAEVDGLEVALDGVPLRRPSWGVATIVDPGEHVVTATAPGKLAWSHRVTLAPTPDAATHGEQAAVEVPPLVDAPAAAPVPAPAPTPPPAPVATATPPAQQSPDTGSGQRTLGAILAGAGVAGVATGAVFGVLALGKWNTAKADCPNGLCPDPATQARDGGAGGLSDASTVGFVAGGALLALGGVLFFSAPNAPSRVGLSLAPRAGGAAATVGATW